MIADLAKDLAAIGPYSWAAAIMAGLVVYLFVWHWLAGGFRTLPQRFASIGDLRGRSLHEIVAAVGEPVSRSAVADGKVVYQWMGDWYHIALLFEGDVCEGVTHEHQDASAAGAAVLIGFVILWGVRSLLFDVMR